MRKVTPIHMKSFTPREGQVEMTVYCHYRCSENHQLGLTLYGQPKKQPKRYAGICRRSRFTADGYKAVTVATFTYILMAIRMEMLSSPLE